MTKFPVNKPHKGKYSGSAGRSYSSSRATMSGGGKGPVNRGGGGNKKGCPLWVLIWVVAPAGAFALGITMIIDSIYRF